MTKMEAFSPDSVSDRYNVVPGVVVRRNGLRNGASRSLSSTRARRQKN